MSKILHWMKSLDYWNNHFFQLFKIIFIIIKMGARNADASPKQMLLECSPGFWISAVRTQMFFWGELLLETKRGFIIINMNRNKTPCSGTKNAQSKHLRSLRGPSRQKNSARRSLGTFWSGFSWLIINIKLHIVVEHFTSIQPESKAEYIEKEK